MAASRPWAGRSALLSSRSFEEVSAFYCNGQQIRSGPLSTPPLAAALGAFGGALSNLLAFQKASQPPWRKKEIPLAAASRRRSSSVQMPRGEIPSVWPLPESSEFESDLARQSLQLQSPHYTYNAYDTIIISLGAFVGEMRLRSLSDPPQSRNQPGARERSCGKEVLL